MSQTSVQEARKLKLISQVTREYIALTDSVKQLNKHRAELQALLQKSYNAYENALANIYKPLELDIK